MPLQLTNTLTGKKEIFTPLRAKKVNMYVCGPTVYGLTHIGNARPLVFFSVVRNFLKKSGYDVTFVSNYTDVDDKIIIRAREEKISAQEVAEKYTREYEKDRSSLGLTPPDRSPKVTQSIPQIIQFIQGLIKNGKAYVADNGEVFYSVRSFPEYGKLSNKKIDELIVGARVQPGEQKKDPLDFSLWKPRKAEDEPAWDSPWGKGRPGWHIECSAMALEAFGETFDIHGGGIDLIHPHHENEIAQSEGLTGKRMVNYWLHNNALTLGSTKMSKSLGNIFLTRDFVTAHSAETLKFLLLSNHYRSPIDFSEKQILETDAALHRIYSALQKAEKWTQEPDAKDAQVTTEQMNLEKWTKDFPGQWRKAMEDDLNTAQALGFVFEYVRAVNAFCDRKNFSPSVKAKTLLRAFLEQIKEFGEVFCIFRENCEKFLSALRARHLKRQGIDEAWVEERVRDRQKARREKDFKRSDALRDELLAKGVLLKDAGEVTVWDVSLQPTP